MNETYKGIDPSEEPVFKEKIGSFPECYRIVLSA
jgi:hypothetical protein